MRLHLEVVLRSQIYFRLELQIDTTRMGEAQVVPDDSEVDLSVEQRELVADAAAGTCSEWQERPGFLRLLSIKATSAVGPAFLRGLYMRRPPTVRIASLQSEVEKPFRLEAEGGAVEARVAM